MNVESQTYRAPADSALWMGTDPVPAKAYYDPDWYEAERQAIFLRSWINIGHVSELPQPGSFIRRELEFAKASLLIVRGKDDVIRAFHNVCTHRATQLVEEEAGKTGGFLCPYHMWNFDLDGSLRSAPDFERFHVAKEDCALKSVAVDSCGGLIFVNLDPAPEQGLRDWLGELADHLDELPCAKAEHFCEYVYEIDANWKMTYDNFQENYHLRFIHPRTGQATFDAQNPYGYPDAVAFFGPHRTQTIWSNPTPSVTPLQAVGFPKMGQFAMQRGLMPTRNDRTYFALFPNFFIIGSPAQNFSHVVYPLSATRSRGVIRLYWVGADSCASERFVREYGFATLRDVHSEDVGVIAAGQRGLNSGALEHIHFQDLEGLCRHLYEMTRERVEAWQATQAEGAGA